MSSNVKIGADSDGDVVADAVSSNYKQINTNAWSMQFFFVCGTFLRASVRQWTEVDQLGLAKKTKNIEFKAKGADLMKLPGASRGLVRVSSQRRFQNGNEDDVMTFPTAAKKHFGSAIHAALLGLLEIFRQEKKQKHIHFSVVFSFSKCDTFAKEPQVHVYMCRQTSRGSSKCARFGTFWTSWGFCFCFGQRVELDEIAECEF